MTSKGSNLVRRSTTIFALLCAFDGMRPAVAQSVTATGDVSPGSPQTPWVIGDYLVVGDTAVGTLDIDAGGMVSNTDAYIGNQNDGAGTITVSGNGAGGEASTWSSSGQAIIGVESGASGTLNILNGGAAYSNAVTIGQDSGSTGAVSVLGPGSTWTISKAPAFEIGRGGSATLLIGNGGAVHSGQAVIGGASGSDGHVTVSGPATLWDPQGNIYVGFEGSGELNVREGAAVSTVGFSGPTSAATIYVGLLAGSSGTVTVSSTTSDISTLSASDNIEVGVGGIGTMTVEKGGLAVAGTSTWIGRSSTSDGTLNLTGDAGGRGILQTGAVIHGGGGVTFNLDGGVLRANRDEADFLRGFTTQAVGTEGAWFDTNTYEVGIGTALSGTSSFHKLGAGRLTLTGDSSTFTGDTVVQAGTLQVDGVLGGPADVLTGGRLTGTGRVGPTTNRGTIAPGPRSGFGALTVAGDYAAQGGGLSIRTQLGDDSSPTDKLLITGATSGTTPVTVTNVGGTGAQTQSGIQVVQVDGNSAGRFALANGDYVIEGQPALVAGAYGYVLQKDPSNGNWYLRSSLKDVNPSAGDDAPLYQPGVPVYEAYANTLLSLSRLGTLRQRVGNRLYDPADTGRNGVWGRVETISGHFDPSVSTAGGDHDMDGWKAQFGVDRVLFSRQDGSRLVGGVNFSYGTANTHVSSPYGKGSIDTAAYGLGPTLTWYGKDGAYVDAQAQATWFNSDLRSSLAGKLENGQNARSYGLGVEAGKAFALDEGFALVPQAQISYVSTHFSAFNDKFGARVDSDRGDSLQGRLGLALDYKRSWQDAGGNARESNAYGVLNVKHEFLEGTRVGVSNVPVGSRMGRTWGGVGFGANYGWSERYAVYGEVAADADFSGSYLITATAGFRMAF
ncbi:autotransporter family protein [Achromobacter denitrificans]